MKSLWLALFVLLLSSQSIAGFTVCSSIIPLEANATLLATQLLPGEIVSSAFHMLPRSRFAVGTAALQPYGGAGYVDVVGGRFVIEDFLTGEVNLSLTAPGYDGKPTALRELTVSPDGRYVAATGGPIFGGPVLMYDTQELKLLHSEAEYRYDHDGYVAQMMQAIRLGMDGQSAYQNFWNGLPGRDELARMYRLNRNAVAQWLITNFERTTGRPSRAEMIPAIGVQFRSDSQSYLVNTGHSVSIRNSQDGAELNRITLYSDLAPPQIDPPSSHFLGYGKFVCAISRHFLTLWDASDGLYLDGIRAPGVIDESTSRFITTSPLGDFIAVSYDINGTIHQVVFTQGVDGEKKPILKQAFAYPGTSIAFSEKQWVSGNPSGLIRVYSLLDNEPLWSFRFTGKYTNGPLAYSSDSRFIAVAGENNNEAAVELWSGVNLQGKQFTFTATPGFTAQVSHLIFSSDRKWLTVTVQEFSTTNPHTISVKAYAIDTERHTVHAANSKG